MQKPRLPTKPAKHGVAVDDVPDAVGKEQTGNQKHQGADDGSVHVVGQPGNGQTMGQKGQDKAGGNGLEKQVGVEFIHEVQTQAGGQAAESGTQGVQQGAPEEHGETGRSQEIAHEEGGEPVALGGLLLRLDHGHSLLHRRLLLTDPAAQAAVPLNAV